MEITKNTKQVKSAVWPCHVWSYDSASADFEKNHIREKGKHTDYLLSAKNDWHPSIYFRFTDSYRNDKIIDDQGIPIRFQYDHKWMIFINTKDASLLTSLCYLLNDKDITIPLLLDRYGFEYERFNSSNEILYFDYFLIKDVNKLCLLIEKLVKSTA